MSSLYLILKRTIYWLDCLEALTLRWLTVLANQSVDTHQVLQQVLVQLDS